MRNKYLQGVLYSGHVNAQLESKTGVELEKCVNETEVQQFSLLVDVMN